MIQYLLFNLGVPDMLCQFSLEQIFGLDVNIAAQLADVLLETVESDPINPKYRSEFFFSNPADPTVHRCSTTWASRLPATGRFLWGLRLVPRIAERPSCGTCFPRQLPV